MSNLITIFKHGEQELEICLEALEQHLKLGWAKVEAKVEELKESDKPGKTQGKQ